VADGQGNAVSLTFTVNTLMGSGVVSPGTGILLNNEMDDFAAAPGVPNAYGLVGGEANAVGPAKIPLSSMTPTLVFRGTPGTSSTAGALLLSGPAPLRLVVGAPGGSTIITTVLQMVVAVVDFDRNVQEAVSAPRVHHQWRPNAIQVEADGVPPEVVRRLAAQGHSIKMGGTWGNAMGIEVGPAGMTGAADPRGEGAALGF
jgi:gamma-glutamyltranspeptidase/glutathione hydrolase